MVRFKDPRFIVQIKRLRKVYRNQAFPRKHCLTVFVTVKVGKVIVIRFINTRLQYIVGWVHYVIGQVVLVVLNKLNTVPITYDLICNRDIVFCLNSFNNYMKIKFLLLLVLPCYSR